MKEVVGSVESLDQIGDRIEAIGLVDLGDVVTETKQWSWLPFVVDNYLQFGWDF